MHFLIRWGINTLSLILTGYFVPGIHINSLWAALMAALLLGLVNAFIKPVLILLTLPINVLTLGLLTFIINGMLLSFVAWAIPGFIIEGFLWAIFGALILSLISTLLSVFIVSAK
ncbi:MAG: phage holin family protein [bacterium]|jgi:putative membrane protein|nr:phage holin family protein [bacterium]